MSMTEIPIAPSEHAILRRWFEGDHLDLIIWENYSGEILRFRLMSRLLDEDEVEGFFWSREGGLRHGHLPSSHGEGDWAQLSWVNENRPPRSSFIHAWRQEGPSLPPMVYAFIEGVFLSNRIYSALN